MVTWAAYPFHRVAITDLRHGAVSMETLIATGVTYRDGVVDVHDLYPTHSSRRPWRLASNRRQ